MAPETQDKKIVKPHKSALAEFVIAGKNHDFLERFLKLVLTRSLM